MGPTARLHWGVCLAVVLLFASLAAGSPQLKRVIVTYQPDGRAAVVSSLKAAQLGVAVVHHSVPDAFVVLEGPAAALAAAASQLPGVVHVEEDRVVKKHVCESGCDLKDVQLRATQRSSNETLPYGIQMVQGSDSSAGPASLLDAGVALCVVDTGIWTAHEDLQGNTFSGCEGQCKTPIDTHGTHVTGTVAAIGGNDIGVVGVISGAAAVVGVAALPYKGGTGSVSLCMEAIQSCANRLDEMKQENPSARMVVQMSFGWPGGPSDSYNRVLQRLYARGDMLFVASAGNDQEDAPGELFYPASYSSVISVAAVDCNATVAPFSQQNHAVELAAPGVNILSTIMPVKLARTSLTVATMGGAGMQRTLQLATSSVDGAPHAQLSKEIVYCGLGTSACPKASRKICLMKRGTSTFACKHLQAQRSGCAALLLANNELPSCLPLDGIEMFNDVLGCPPLGGKHLPAATLSRADGLKVRAMLRDGRRAMATLSVAPGSSATLYQTMDGTSMAAPHVSAVAAKVWAAHPNCTNADVRAALREGAKDLGDAGRDPAYGFGLVQADGAAAALAAKECATADKPSARRTPRPHEVAV